MIVKQATGVGFGIGVELDEVAGVEEGVSEGMTSEVEETVEELCKVELEDTMMEEVDAGLLEGIVMEEV